MTFQRIERRHVRRHWPQAQPWIAEAVVTSRGKFTKDWFRDRLVAGDMQLWLLEDGDTFGVVVTQVYDYPANRCCLIRIATGRNVGDAIEGGIRQIEDWARSQGCHAMELIARLGWKRRLTDYDMTHVVLEKQL